MADLSRDLGKARDAYAEGDAESSKKAHDAKKNHSPEKHQAAGKWLKSIIFGGLDGLLQTFAVVSSVAGGNLPPLFVLVLGFATNIADAMSMGLGDFLSTKAELDFSSSERDRETWECDNYMEGEKMEMKDLYISRGISPEDAQELVDIMAKDKKTFVDIMMIEELGLMPDDDESPLGNGLVTFGSFIAFGSVPLVSYIATQAATDGESHAVPFIVCIVLTQIMLFFLGAVKGRLTSQSVVKTGLLMNLNGTLAGGTAYIIGMIIKAITHVDSLI